MSDPNDLIVGRIKKARVERGKTQQDLARHLKRTAAAISDLERGKVQVSAADLYRISQLLNQPIEYFYGIDYGSQQVRDMLAVLRVATPEAQAQTASLVTMMMSLNGVVDELKTVPKDDQQAQFALVQEFFQAFIPFSGRINQLTAQLNALRDQLTRALEVNGIDVSQLVGQKQDAEPVSQPDLQVDKRRRRSK